ncbi:MAG: hypothetical protein AABY41_03660, partial [Nitrospirota bacterium]
DEDFAEVLKEQIKTSDKTDMSQGSQRGMKISPPLNPLPQGEGRYEEKPANPPPLTGGGEGEGERRISSDEKVELQDELWEKV